VVADVVLKAPEAEGNSTLERDILHFCRRALDAHKVPATIRFVPMLNIGESGKLVRRHA
jgi:acyl-coenzyme A synthetase/AMP-(fatty) acid ligase